MSVNAVNSDGSLLRVAGGILYADAPIGTISPFGGSVVPSGYLLCNGQAVSRTTYAALFATIGVAFGSGDGSTTFNLPDLRETVPVGSGTRGSGVTDHDTYTVGQFKDDQLQEHAHYGTWARRTGTYFQGVGSSEYEMQDNPSVSHEGVYGARTGSTTHGKQLGVNYIIKAKQIAVPADFVGAVDEAIAEELHYNNRVLNNVRLFITSSQIHTFTATKTGFLKVYMHKNDSGYTARLKVNEVQIDQISCYGSDSSGTVLPWIENSGIDVTLSAFVKEGDIIKIDSDESGSASTESWYIYATVLQYKE